MKPDDLPKWMTEENIYQVKLLGACWVTPEQIARALLQAEQRGRREGMEEAAEIADKQAADDSNPDMQWQARIIANAIRAKTEVQK